MAHRQWEVGFAPLVLNGVDIGVANARSFDINNYVILARIAALEREYGMTFPS